MKRGDPWTLCLYTRVLVPYLALSHAVSCRVGQKSYFQTPGMRGTFSQSSPVKSVAAVGDTTVGIHIININKEGICRSVVRGY